MKYIDAVMTAEFCGEIAREGWKVCSIWAPFQEYLMGRIVTPLDPADANATDWVVLGCLRLDEI